LVTIISIHFRRSKQCVKRDHNKIKHTKLCVGQHRPMAKAKVGPVAMEWASATEGLFRYAAFRVFKASMKTIV
jgi:hypothetical protein